MAQHVYDDAGFRVQFAQFANTTKYPDPTLSGYFDMANCFMSDWDNCELWGKCLQTALNLLTAHIAALMTLAATGRGKAGIVNSSTVGQVSVGLQLAPSTNGWQFWLSQTPYGLSYWAMLEAMSSGGFYIGGLPEQEAFRKVAGIF